MVVTLNRPKAKNAVNIQMFADIASCFNKISKDFDVSVVIIKGSEGNFSSGLDLKEAPLIASNDGEDVARKAYRFKQLIAWMQETQNSIEQCRVPVIAAVEGICIGEGLDIITSCDIRYCTTSAKFSIREVHIGMVADMGTLQRISKIVGNDSWVREIAYTARFFNHEEALKNGLVSRVFESGEELMKNVSLLAKEISEKSPVAIHGTKYTLNYAREHSIKDSLEQIQLLNAAFLQTDDLIKAVQGTLEKKKPLFSKL